MFVHIISFIKKTKKSIHRSKIKHQYWNDLKLTKQKKQTYWVPRLEKKTSGKSHLFLLKKSFQARKSKQKERKLKDVQCILKLASWHVKLSSLTIKFNKLNSIYLSDRRLSVFDVKWCTGQKSICPVMDSIFTKKLFNFLKSILIFCS